MGKEIVSKDDVSYISKLARIHLQEEDIAPMRKNLEDILGYIQSLDELDTSDIEPTSHPLPLKDVFREDIVKVSLTQQEALCNAIDQRKGSFKVPKVIE